MVSSKLCYMTVLFCHFSDSMLRPASGQPRMSQLKGVWTDLVIIFSEGTMAR